MFVQSNSTLSYDDCPLYKKYTFKLEIKQQKLWSFSAHSRLIITSGGLSNDVVKNATWVKSVTSGYFIRFSEEKYFCSVSFETYSQKY